MSGPTALVRAGIAILLITAACSQDQAANPAKKSDKPKTTTVVHRDISATQGQDDTNDVYNRHYLPNGRFVWCLSSDDYGMDCDWVEYHHRYNDLKPRPTREPS